MDSKPTLEEMAYDLPEQAGKGKGGKAQLLLVAEILKAYTDEEHGLTADEIREIIGIRTGSKPTAAKVRDDIHALADCGLFGMDIVIPSRGEVGGFRCKHTFLSSEDVRLAINMVRTCKFVTRSQRSKICDELYSMVSFYQQDGITASVAVDERDLPSRPDVFAAANTFLTALDEGKMVSFQYAAKGLDGDEHYSRIFEGRTLFVETPIDLVFSFGNYYAETWLDAPEGGNVLVRRLDRIRNARVSDIPAVQCDAIDELRRSVQERIGQMFDMFGVGEARDLFLRVSAWGARYVYDRFGHNIEFKHIAEDGTCGYARVRVRPAATFYRWLFGMGEEITLAKPQGALWEEVFWPERERRERKSHDELIADYEFAIAGMRKQMKRAAQAYGWKIAAEDSAD